MNFSNKESHISFCTSIAFSRDYISTNLCVNSTLAHAWFDTTLLKFFFKSYSDVFNFSSFWYWSTLSLSLSLFSLFTSELYVIERGIRLIHLTSLSNISWLSWLMNILHIQIRRHFLMNIVRNKNYLVTTYASFLLW